MVPHTTKVPAEKKLINSDVPLIHHGTCPPPPKKLSMPCSPLLRAKATPAARMTTR
jgi:hypothetical protein